MSILHAVEAKNEEEKTLAEFEKKAIWQWLATFTMECGVSWRASAICIKWNIKEYSITKKIDTYLYTVWKYPRMQRAPLKPW